MHNTFRSLAGYNYRTYAIGALASNIGTWMQRTAQDWIVLTDLTHHNATAVGVVMSMQFAPQLLCLPWSGYVADRFDRRRLLWITQTINGLLALGLGLLTVTHLVRLWHVYAFAFALGVCNAFDVPARNAFVSDLVSEDDLPNAVALNSSSFNAARMLGPAAAGLVIAGVGTGWVFILNALSFGAVLLSLACLRAGELHVTLRADQKRGGNLGDGFRYVWQRPDLKVVLFMVFLIGTFGLNFPIFISTMAVSVFHKGAGQFGLATSAMAIGTFAGAILAAGRARPSVALLLGAAGVFGLGFVVAAAMPSYGLFCAALALVGIASQTFTTGSNSTLQLGSEPHMRGRVTAIFLAIALGTTPLGAPLVGRIADAFGPRVALGVGAAAGFGAALVGLGYLLRFGPEARRRASARQAA